MPLYEYKALDKNGKNIKGSVSADSQKSARSKLKKDSIYVIEIKDKSKSAAKNKKNSKSGKAVGISDIANMTRQLASLLKAKIPLVESLGAAAEQCENPVLKDALFDCKNQVNEGSSFHKTLQNYPKIFNITYNSMCEAGEMSGTLDTMLIRLAEFNEAQNELQSKVKSAVMYPIIMLAGSALVLGILFVFVVPQLTAVFEDSEMQIPWYTELVIAMSGIFVNYWTFLLVGLIVFLVLFFNWKTSETGKPTWDAISLKLPFFGKITRMVAISRFTRTLSTLLAGGVPILNALDIVKNVVNNHVLAQAIIKAKDNITEGESIAEPLKKSKQFPPIVIHMVKVGERTGELESMLSQVSDSYDFQVKNTVESLTSILNPILILVMGGVIGFIVVSFMVPMIEMANIGG